MTEPAKRVTLGVLTALLVAMLSPIVLGAWVPKVTKAEFDLHVQNEAAFREAVLDLLCADHPAHRRCR